MTQVQEERRLETLLSYDILDSPEEEQYNDLVQLAATILGVPAALITLIDRDRQWFKSRIGFEEQETSLELAFCRHMVPTGQPLVVADASKHKTFANYPNVIGNPHIRFYAGVPLQAPEGEVLGALCAIDYKPREITEEQLNALKILGRQVEVQLELRRKSRQLQVALDEVVQARRARDTFFATISHDIRTPVSAIVGGSQLLSRCDEPERANLIANGIAASAKTLLHLLNNLLDLAKMESGRLELVESSFDLPALLQETLDSVCSIGSSKGVESRLTIGEGLATRYVGDALRVRQVLGNLLSNALKFTTKGVVELCVEGRGEEVVFEVRDSGIGIQPDRLKAIFEEFEQASAHTQTQFGGTGLGLSIVMRLTELMSGWVEVESEPGKGSIFRVTLPLVPDEGTSHPAGRKVSHALIVEDNEVHRLILESMLDDYKVSCVHAGSCAEARRVFQEEDFDAVFLDQQLPDGLGTGLAREFRALRGKNVLIFGISAAIGAQVRRAYQAAGMDGCLTKPFSRDEISSLVSF
ncbi:MAG TPA: ATP-binding protein [Fimbriimonas sp.]